ncbi:unnamed protein product [Pleuronectes platessa]|uniref:Uncharacterized protein n=1 Tax=Pleuronectes platessa TaxID=8262 RepID=A0A9N7YKY0_PLEPL|nr:unnamed protein product [Pleuronectes platessa]
MQCANRLRKRSVEQQPWSCRAKRVCLEFQSSECPMETNHGFIGANQQEEQQTQVAVVRPRLSCPRCLGGEPGHINHIMGK